MNYKSLGLCVCGKEIFAGSESCEVLHMNPPCNVFLQLGVVEFLTFVRRSRGIPDDFVLKKEGEEK